MLSGIGGSEIILLVGLLISTGAFDYRFDRIDYEKPDKIFDISKLRVVRVRQGVYGLNGQVKLLQNLYQNATFEAKSYVSLVGNSHYILMPFRFAPKSYCEYLNTNYKKYIMESLTAASDFPVIGDEYFCPFKKGVYRINNYVWDPDSMPILVSKPGFYKIEFITKTADGDSSKWSIYLEVLHY